MIGTLFGSYRVVGIIGGGGMGTIYRAEHTLIGRPAAVKVLNPTYARERTVVNRFFNEARAATAIQHPGIVEVFDFGYQPDGTAFIVMEFLAGESLASRITSRGTLLETEAFAIARGIASALAAAHARGIVHRDIKPDNVFLVPDAEVATGERVKLLDFGIAKLSDVSSESWSQTRTGAVLGTPSYMAPEQCAGAGKVDHRADLYSLGCVVFEMMTGRPPFVGAGAGEVIGAHQYVPAPSLRQFAPHASLAAEELVARLLAKLPEQRPATAADVVRMLGARGGVHSTGSHHHIAVGTTGEIHSTTTLGGAATMSPRAVGGRRRGLWIGGAATVVLGAGALALALAGGGGDDGDGGVGGGEARGAGATAVESAGAAVEPAASPVSVEGATTPAATTAPVDAGVDVVAPLDAAAPVDAAAVPIDAGTTRPRPRPRPRPSPSPAPALTDDDMIKRL